MNFGKMRGYGSGSQIGMGRQYGGIRGGIGGVLPRPGMDRYQYGDGLLSAIGKAIIKPLTKLVPKHTIAGKILGAVGLGAAGAAVSTAIVPAAAKTVPALPTAMTLPTLPSPAVGAGFGGAITSALPFWKGPGGKMQWPWQDPATLQGLKSPFVLDDSYLRIQYRAPRGYVIIRDNQGRPYPIMKSVARTLGVWTPARKPPISAGDWRKFMTAKAVEKKLRKIAGKGLKTRTRTVYTSKRGK